MPPPTRQKIICKLWFNNYIIKLYALLAYWKLLKLNYKCPIRNKNLKGVVCKLICIKDKTFKIMDTKIKEIVSSYSNSNKSIIFFSFLQCGFYYQFTIGINKNTSTESHKRRYKYFRAPYLRFILVLHRDHMDTKIFTTWLQYILFYCCCQITVSLLQIKRKSINKDSYRMRVWLSL